MKEIYSVEEIQKIEKKEFERLKNSYILMKRAGTLFCVDQETTGAMVWLFLKF